jgi:hypothetical protein
MYLFYSHRNILPRYSGVLSFVCHMVFSHVLLNFFFCFWKEIQTKLALHFLYISSYYLYFPIQFLGELLIFLERKILWAWIWLNHVDICLYSRTEKRCPRRLMTQGPIIPSIYWYIKRSYVMNNSVRVPNLKRIAYFLGHYWLEKEIFF